MSDQPHPEAPRNQRAPKGAGKKKKKQTRKRQDFVAKEGNFSTKRLLWDLFGILGAQHGSEILYSQTYLVPNDS